MYSLPMAMFVTLLPLTYSTLSSLLVWSIIIFFAEMVVFNVVLINAETTDWIKYVLLNYKVTFLRDQLLFIITKLIY